MPKASKSDSMKDVPTPRELRTVEGGTKLVLQGRDPSLPNLYVVESHPLVAEGHGKIIIALQDMRPAAMEKLYAASATESLPTDVQDAQHRGGSAYAQQNPSGDADRTS